MIKKKFEIDRRTMLKGSGVALALPLLEIMMPSFLRAQENKKPFIINMIWPNGCPAFYKQSEVFLNYNTADASGRAKDLHPYYLMEHYLKDMSPALKSMSYMVGNTSNSWCENNYNFGRFPAHWGNAIGIYNGAIDISKYTSIKQTRSSNGDDFMLETYDQRIARHFGLKTLNAFNAPASSEVNTWTNRRIGESISWYKYSDGKTTRPVHIDFQPRDIFDRLVGAEVMTDPASVTARRELLTGRKTVLDGVLDDIRKLQGQLGFEDKARLDDYLTGVRELDAKTASDLNAVNESGGNNSGGSCSTSMTRPKEFFYDYNSRDYVGQDYYTKLRLFQDLMTLGMECGLYHVHGLGMSGEGAGIMTKDPNDRPAGMPAHYNLWHGCSHWKSSTAGGGGFDGLSAAEIQRHINYRRETYADYAKMSVDFFKQWMERLALKKLPDGTSFLDNTFATLTSYIGDGNSHAYRGMPTFMAGGAGGRIPKHNGHVFGAENKTSGTERANIWLSAIQAMGINETSFNSGENILGGSRGTLTDFLKPHSS